MGNFKVKVNNEAESKEAQELFFELGYGWHAHGKKVSYLNAVTNGEFSYLVAWSTGCFTDVIQCGCGSEDAKEITLPELRDMVKPSINDQYAEIEQVRQAIKVPDGNDSDHALDAMSFNLMSVGRDKARQHRHYFIDVSDVDEIDFYEIALRYNVTDPCIQHILKKCLAVGQRGQKDFHHDLKDIYDTAKRMLDVHGLDS